MREPGNPERPAKWALFAATAVLVVLQVVPVLGQVVKKPQPGLDALVRVSDRLRVPEAVEPMDQYRQEEGVSQDPTAQKAVAAWDRFLTENGTAWTATMDRRTGCLSLAAGSGIPWIPGKGNKLILGDVPYRSASGAVTESTLVSLAGDFMRRYPDLFGVEPGDLVVNLSSTGQFADYLWYVEFQRRYHEIPVEGAYVVLRVNHGNLIQFGGQFLGRMAVDTGGGLDLDTARQILESYIGGFKPGDGWVDRGQLSILPLAPAGDDGQYLREPGEGVEYHLAYTLSFRRPGEPGTWSAKIDAHSGEILMFVDANKYGSIKGGVYITSNLDTETVRPMGYADSGSGNFANGAGVYPQASGAVTTTLAGKYIAVVDTCGSISLGGTAPADLNLGTSAGTDCTTPGFGGAGNTHASRTTYYHMTMWKEKAMAWLPSNAWLQGQLTDNVNLDQVCNAYWDGSAVNFFKSGGGCSNTGELPTVFLHEIGHGLDDNDGSPSSTVGSSEMYADTNAILMTHQSCIGVNFVPGQNCDGYGNGCSSCTGIRDADYTKHTSQTPATPACLTSACGGYTCSVDSSYPGPCGYEGHCESYIGSEANFDVGGRDLPAAGYSAETSWYIMERLFYLSRPTSGDTYTCSSPSSANGCGASNWYETYLAVDDDNGNLGDGTPHAASIYAAFNRHGIACSTGNHTSYSVCGTIGQPTLTATAGVGQVGLSWTAATGASQYKVLRGELGATASLTIIATTSSTSYTDTAVAVGITYFYSVIAIGASDACFGSQAAVQSATPTACVVPGSPTIGTATVPGNNQISIPWTAGAPAGATYKLYRSIGVCPGGSFTLLASGLTASPYLDSTVSGGTTYSYKISAMDGTGGCESTQSGCTSATATGACTMAPTFAGLVSVSNPGGTTCALTLSWSAGTTNCSGSVSYRVYRSTTYPFTPAAGNRIASGVSGASYGDSASLVSGTTYYYIVHAVDGGNGSEDTNAVTQSGVPTGPVVSGTWSETFEPSGTPVNSGWAVDNIVTGAANPWAASTAQHHGGSASRFDTDDSTRSDHAYESPVITIAASSVLTFWHTFSFENGSGVANCTSDCYDGGVLEYKKASGAWTRITGAQISGSSYNGSIDTSGITDNPLGTNVPAWVGGTGTLPAWAQATVNIGAVTGAGAIQLRWRQGDDTGNLGNNVGWYIDDIQVTNAQIPGSCSTAGTPQRVPYSLTPTKITTSDHGTTGAVTWDASHCGSASYHIIYGKGENIAAWTVDGGKCSIGLGNYAWSSMPDPSSYASRFLWFLVVGDNGSSTEGSWGLTSGSAEEGGANSSGVCGMTSKNTSATCGTP